MKLTSKKQQNLATRVSWNFRHGVALAASVLVIGSVTAQAIQPDPSQSANTPNRNQITTNEVGLMIAKDQETGQARPVTAEEAQKLAAGINGLLNQSSEGLVKVRRPDGSYSLNLQGRFQSAMLARKEADGSVAHACVDTPGNAAAFFDIDATLVNSPKRAINRSAPAVLETQ